MDRETALRRFGSMGRAQIEANEARWHPDFDPDKRSALANVVIFGLAAAATLGYLLIAGVIIAILLAILFLLL